MEVWENRCYSEGIPDYIEAKLMRSMRVPSYKAIAISILKCDRLLLSCGFKSKTSNLEKLLREQRIDSLNPQLKLF